MDIPRLEDRQRLKSQPPNMTFMKAYDRQQLDIPSKITTSKHDVFEGKTERHEAYVLPFFEGGQQLDLQT